MRPVFRTPPPLGTRRTTTQRTKYGDDSYTIAASALAVRLGEYCSYCEAPVQGALQVEHMMAKLGGNNSAANEWCNFLLACNQCNAKKNKNPDSEERLSNYIWPSVVARLPTVGNPAEWSFSFDMFSYDLRLPLAGEVLELTQLNPAVAHVFVSPNVARDATMQDRAERTIALTGLNACAPLTRPGDRRFIERTAAWSAADALATAYLPILTNAATPAADLQALEAEISGAALAFGFWSVWMTVFRGRLAVLPVCDAKLRSLFITQFPGTFYFSAAERTALAAPVLEVKLPPTYFGAYSSGARVRQTPYDFPIVP